MLTHHESYRSRLTSRPDAILVTLEKTCNINSQNQQNYPMIKALL